MSTPKPTNVATPPTPSQLPPTAGNAAPPPPALLTARQEAEIRDIYHANVRARCGDEIRAFAACTSSRTVSIVWACRDAHAAMNKCMIAHATREEEDRAREEWFGRAPERAREREEREEQKREMWRRKAEWWEFDERTGRRIRKGEGGGG